LPETFSPLTAGAQGVFPSARPHGAFAPADLLSRVPDPPQSFCLRVFGAIHLRRHAAEVCVRQTLEALTAPPKFSRGSLPRGFIRLSDCAKSPWHCQTLFVPVMPAREALPVFLKKPVLK